MKKILSAVSVSLLALSLIQPAFAARRVEQRARIHQGVESGELNHKEAAGLRAEQRKTRRVERRAHADGNVSPEERAKINSMRDQDSKDIYEQKHDDQVRK